MCRRLRNFFIDYPKINRDSAEKVFFDYLDYREAFHERLVCSDKLKCVVYL